MAIVAFSAVGATASGDIAGYRATPYGEILDDLESAGHEIVTPTDPRATHFLSFDHNADSFRSVAAIVPVERRILVVFEPRVVLPSNYKRRVRSRYGTVLGMAPFGSVTHFVPWPQIDWRLMVTASPERIKGTTAIVNSNKLSSIAGSLYGLRRRVIQQFSDKDLPLLLAGPNWLRAGRALAIENVKAVLYAIINGERVDWSEWAVPLRLGGSITHLGKVDDKDAVLRAAEFAVVIENSATYVSEKLFDAIIAGCVPLYVGPGLGTYGIPEAVAVAVPPRASSFTDAVERLTTDQKQAVLDAGRAWLADDATFAKWSMSPALAHLAQEIDAAIKA